MLTHNWDCVQSVVACLVICCSLLSPSVLGVTLKLFLIVTVWYTLWPSSCNHRKGWLLLFPLSLFSIATWWALNPVCSISFLSGTKPGRDGGVRCLQFICSSNFTKSPLLIVESMLTSLLMDGVLMTTPSMGNLWSCSWEEETAGVSGGKVLFTWLVVTERSKLRGKACSGLLYLFLIGDWKVRDSMWDCIHGSCSVLSKSHSNSTSDCRVTTLCFKSQVMWK